MPANEFDNAFIAQTYDLVEGDRSDLDVYLQIAHDLWAQTVLDVGCGTGVLAAKLAAKGVKVTGVEPAGAMLDVARSRPGVDGVQWIHGDATDVPGDLRADLAVMTANVAQVFTTDEAWLETLTAIRAALRPGGRLVFESRDPRAKAWEQWAATPASSFDAPGIGTVQDTFELVDVSLPLVAFRSTNQLPDGQTVTFESTLIFRTKKDFERTLAAAGFTDIDIRDLPRAPGRAWLVACRG